MLMLAPGTTSLTLEQLSSNTLSIDAEDGWLSSPFDIVYRARTGAFSENYHVQLSDVRIQVVAWTRDGRPKKVNFTFQRELEDESLRRVLYERGRYVPFAVPAVGGRAAI